MLGSREGNRYAPSSVVLMACDSMTGQDAVIQAREFMREVDVTGFVLTKLDGESRGGAALSITNVTGKPIYFAGVGEKLADLEPFYPDRMASRIIGMGDVLTLIDKAQRELDQEKAVEVAERMAAAQFTLEDFLEQMRQVKKLGPLQDLLSMLPGVPGAKGQLKDLQLDEKELDRTEAIICSMTREERTNPAMIGGSRRLRIARGSGTTTHEVNALLKEFAQAKKMMRSMMGMAGFGSRGMKGMRLPKLPPGRGQDQIDADGGDQAALLSGRGGRFPQPPRWAVHREHREVPPSRGPLAHRHRRRPGSVLAVAGRSAHGSGAEPPEDRGHLGAFPGVEEESLTRWAKRSWSTSREAWSTIRRPFAWRRRSGTTRSCSSCTSPTTTSAR